MIHSQRDQHFGEYQWILRPNASLNLRQAKWIVGVIGLLMAIIGLSFAAIGAWLILPFSGGELILFTYALGSTIRQAAAYEIITITRDKIRIEKKNPASACCHEFHRTWARIDWLPGSGKRLAVGSHGRWVEIGAFLVEEEKQTLAQTLQQQARTLEF